MLSTLTRSTFLALVLAIGVATSSVAEDADAETSPAQLELTTEQVIVFKDGYCLVVKKGIAFGFLAIHIRFISHAQHTLSIVSR